MAEIDNSNDDIRLLVQDVISDFEANEFNQYIQDRKDYLGYTGDRAKKIKPFQSNIFFPLVGSICDTLYASLYDAKTKFGVTDANDKTDDENKTVLLNKAYDYKASGHLSRNDFTKECIITGKGFGRTFLNTDIIKNKIRNKSFEKVIKMPTMKYTSIFNVFYDKNFTIDESPFRIERYIMSKKQIINEYLVHVESLTKGDTETPEGRAEKRRVALSFIENKLSGETPYRFSEYDPNRVKHIIAYSQTIADGNLSTKLPLSRNRTKTAREQQSAISGNDGANIDDRNNVYAVNFKINKVYELVKVVMDDYVYIYIDGKRLYKKKIDALTEAETFIDLSYSKIPGSALATGVARQIREQQAIINTLYNIFLDGLKMDVAPMFEQVGGGNILTGESGTLEYKPFEVVSTTQGNSIRKIELGLGKFEPLNAIQFLLQEAYKRVGINEYFLGGQSKVERVTGGVELLNNTFRSKLLPITNSMQVAMGKVSKSFLLLFANHFTENELKKLGFEGKDGLDIEGFIDESNITFEFNSLALLEKMDNLNRVMEHLPKMIQFSNGTIDINKYLKGLVKGDLDIDNLFKENEPQAQGFQPKIPNPQGGLVKKVEGLQL